MKAKDFDKKFDDGVEDIIADLDISTATRINQGQKRVNVDFPAWVVESLDREAARIGVTRQSIIKVWLVERLRAEARASNEPDPADQTYFALSKEEYDAFQALIDAPAVRSEQLRKFLSGKAPWRRMP